MKPALNVVVLGAPGSGKSTLIGHLLAKLGEVDSQLLAKAEKEAGERGQFAWLLYRRKVERMRGCTLSLCVRNFSTPKYEVSITDVPGRRQGIRCVASGVAGQDVAVLVVDGSSGAEGVKAVGDTFEGILHEHALLASALGVRQLVVAVNKMDTAGYDEAAFREVEAEVRKVLRKAQFPPTTTMTFIPLSGQEGHNLLEVSAITPWYERQNGRSLVEALNAMTPRERAEPWTQAEGPQLLLPIQEVVKVSGIGPVCTGRLKAGALAAGQEVLVLPEHAKSIVKSVEHNCCLVEDALDLLGANIGVALKGGQWGVSLRQLRPGSFLCSTDKPPLPALSFQAKVRLLRTDLFGRSTEGKDGTEGSSQNGPSQGSKRARKGAGDEGEEEAGEGAGSSHRSTAPEVHAGQGDGYCPVLEMLAGRLQCRLTKVVHLLDKQTGQPVPGPPPRVLRKGDAAVVEFSPLRPSLIMAHKESPSMGCFVIREKQYVVGMGVVTSVEHDKEGSPEQAWRRGAHKAGHQAPASSQAATSGGPMGRKQSGASKRAA